MAAAAFSYCIGATQLLASSVGRAQPVAPLWLEMAWGQAAALLLLLLQIGLGLALFRLPYLRHCRLKSAAKLVFAMGLGLYASYVILLSLALAGSLSTADLLLYLLIASGASLWVLGRREQRDAFAQFEPVPVATLASQAAAAPGPTNDIPGAARGPALAPAVGPAPAPRRPWLPTLLLLLAAAVFLAPYWLQTLLPEHDYDAALYHLPMAQRLLDVGPWPSDPMFEGYSFPAGFHLFYALLLGLGAQAAIIPWNLLTGLIVVLAVYALGEHFWDRRVGVVAALLCAGCNVAWEVCLDARIEPFLTLSSVLCVFAFLLWRQQPRQAGLLLLCATQLSLALAAKYTAVLLLILPGLAVLILAILDLRRSPPAAGDLAKPSGIPGDFAATRSVGDRPLSALAIALAVLIVIFPSAFWYARNAWQYGDPVYAMLRGPVYVDAGGAVQPLSPALDKLLADSPAVTLDDLPPDLADAARRAENRAASPWPKDLFNLPDLLLHSERYERRPLHSVTALLLAALFLPLLLLAENGPFSHRLGRLSPALWLLAIALFFYLAIGSQTFLIRYALPALALLCVPAAVVLAHFRRRPLLHLLAALLALQLAFNSVSEWQRFVHLGGPSYLLGNTAPMTFLAEVGYNRSRAMAHLIPFVEGEIAAGTMHNDDCIFFLGEGPAYLLPCRYLPDLSRNGRRFLVEMINAGGDEQLIAQSLRRQGVTHLAYSSNFAGWALANAQPEERRGLLLAYQAISGFAQRHGRVIYETPVDRVTLVELHDGKPGGQ